MDGLLSYRRYLSVFTEKGKGNWGHDSFGRRYYPSIYLPVGLRKTTKIPNRVDNSNIRNLS
jgi:hypothetical protein